MPKLVWSATGDRTYQSGVDRGVLYVDTEGVAWNGLISVEESPVGGSATPYYVDGVKYIQVPSAVEFEATVEAYTYPDEFAECDGTEEVLNGLFVTEQQRKAFGLSYRSLIGNDVDGLSHAYKIHLIYNALAEPSKHTNSTLNEAVDPANFSWQITTQPELVKEKAPSAHFVIDSRATPPALLTIIEDVLYGNSEEDARLPTVHELLYIFNSYDSRYFDAGEVGEPYYRTLNAGEVGTTQTNTIDAGRPE